MKRLQPLLSPPLKALLVGYGPVCEALARRLHHHPDVDFCGQVSLAVQSDGAWPQWTVTSVHHYGFTQLLAQLKPHVVLVASWGEKFSSQLLARPNTVFLNCHGSLLPRHRGPNPYIATILSGETMGGVTFHWMEPDWDTGPIALQQAVEVASGETGQSLQQKVANAAQGLVPQLVRYLLAGTLPAMVQPTEGASYDRVTPHLAEVDWAKCPSQVIRQARAFQGWRPLWSQFEGALIEFEDVQLEDGSSAAPAGTILAVQGRSLVIASGSLHQVFRVRCAPATAVRRLKPGHRLKVSSDAVQSQH